MIVIFKTWPISQKFASQALESAKKSLAKKFRHARVIKKYDGTFEENQFAEYAQQLYIEAHEHLMKYIIRPLLEFSRSQFIFSCFKLFC